MSQDTTCRIPSILDFADPQDVFEKAMRTMVEAVIPLEALILSNGLRNLSPAMQEGVINGAQAVRGFLKEVMS